jgi:hypothetical protein
MDDAASVVRQHHEHKHHAERDGGDREKSIEASWGDVIVRKARHD